MFFDFQEILVVRLQPISEEEKTSYISLYSYLSSKKRWANLLHSYLFPQKKVSKSPLTFSVAV